MLKSKEACINTTQDSEIYLKTAFKDDLGSFILKKDDLNIKSISVVDHVI
jgi:hypothetical protein